MMRRDAGPFDHLGHLGKLEAGKLVTGHLDKLEAGRLRSERESLPFYRIYFLDVIQTGQPLPSGVSLPNKHQILD